MNIRIWKINLWYVKSCQINSTLLNLIWRMSRIWMKVVSHIKLQRTSSTFQFSSVSEEQEQSTKDWYLHTVSEASYLRDLQSCSEGFSLPLFPSQVKTKQTLLFLVLQKGKYEKQMIFGLCNRQGNDGREQKIGKILIWKVKIYCYFCHHEEFIIQMGKKKKTKQYFFLNL